MITLKVQLLNKHTINIILWNRFVGIKKKTPALHRRLHLTQLLQEGLADRIVIAGIINIPK
jgi:hypothetical protein